MVKCYFIFREFGIQVRLPRFGGKVRRRFYWVQVVPFRSVWFILQAIMPFRVVSLDGSILVLLCSCEFAGPKPLVSSKLGLEPPTKSGRERENESVG